MKIVVALWGVIAFVLGGMEIMVDSVRFDRLTDCFDNVAYMTIYNQGNQINLKKGNDKFEVVLKALKDDTYHCHEMPGFGVDGDMIEEQDKNKGIWLELCFDTVCSHDGFDFDSLLFEVKKDKYDIDIIRRVNGKIAGQCFYLSLDNSLKGLYFAISEVIK